MSKHPHRDTPQFRQAYGDDSDAPLRAGGVRRALSGEAALQTNAKWASSGYGFAVPAQKVTGEDVKLYQRRLKRDAQRRAREAARSSAVTRSAAVDDAAEQA